MNEAIEACRTAQEEFKTTVVNCCKAMVNLVKAMVNLVKAFVNTYVSFCAPKRLVYLALHANKRRVRKKNLHRLLKLMST